MLTAIRPLVASEGMSSGRFWLVGGGGRDDLLDHALEPKEILGDGVEIRDCRGAGTHDGLVAEVGVAGRAPSLAVADLPLTSHRAALIRRFAAWFDRPPAR